MKNYISKFSSIANFLKFQFKSNRDLAKEAHLSSQAIQKGDLDEFHKYFNLKNPHISFSEYGVDIAINGSYDLFLKLEKIGIENNLIEKKFYNNVFYWSFARDNEEIVKHLINKNHFSVFDIDENLFQTMVENNAEKILLFSLYDLNYQVSDNMINWLTVYKSNQDILDKIQKRDLFFQLNDMHENILTKSNRLKI